MNSVQLGKSDLTVSRLAYGCMRIAGTWNPKEITPEREANGRAALLAAYEAGYTLFDHADIYCAGGCESIHGRLLKDSPELRRQTIIATKCGIRFGDDKSPHRFDFSKEHILWSVDQSLERLGIEQIDLYQLHRPDVLMEPAEVAEAFEILHRQGKVKRFGVSNFFPNQYDLLAQFVPFPLVVNQLEMHLGYLDPFVNGTTDQCQARNVTPLAWSPLGGGWLGAGGKVPEGDKREKILEVLDAHAEKYGVSRTVMSLAWLMRHPSGIVPIVGSANPVNIADAAKADGIHLERDDWYRIYIAARGRGLP
jgi:predicted oxidoreductase